MRNMELQEALTAAQAAINSLTQHLHDSEKRREAQVADVVRQRDEVMEINAQLFGHRNAKQKIQYLLKVKEEKEDLKREKTRLESIVRQLAGNAATAAALLNAKTLVAAGPAVDQSPSFVKADSTIVNSSVIDAWTDHGNDSTMISLAPTEGAPATPGPCVLDETTPKKAAKTPQTPAMLSRPQPPGFVSHTTALLPQRPPGEREREGGGGRERKREKRVREKREKVCVRERLLLGTLHP